MALPTLWTEARDHRNLRVLATLTAGSRRPVCAKGLQRILLDREHVLGDDPVHWPGAVSASNCSSLNPMSEPMSRARSASHSAISRSIGDTVIRDS
jgi:hypothetical protein